MADKKGSTRGKTAEQAKKLQIDEKAQKRIKEQMAESLKLEAEYLRLQGKKVDAINKLKQAHDFWIQSQTDGLQKVSDMSAEEREAYKAKFQDLADLKKFGVESFDALNEKADKYTEKQKKGRRAAAEFGGAIAKHMGIATDVGDTFVGKMMKLNTILKDTESAEGFRTKMAEMFSPISIGESLIRGLVELTAALALSLDKATSSFAKNTGAGRSLAGNIATVHDEYKRFGVSAEEVAKASQALYEQFPGFIDLQDDLKNELIGSVAAMAELGVSAQETARTYTMLEKSLGFAQGQVANVHREIIMGQMAMGKTFQQGQKDLSSSMKTLAVYGKRAPDVFKNVAAQARAAGVEVGDLLALSKKFDTFSSAAETAAKMNAVFGTSLSGTNMLMLEEDERIEMLRSQFQAMGRDFQDLGRFEKKAAANILGFGDDVQKAGMVLGMTSEQFKNFQAKADAADKSTKAFEDKMQDAIPALQHLKMILLELIQPTTEFIEAFREGVIWIKEWAKWIGDNVTGVVLGLIFVLGAATFAFGFFMKTVIASSFPLTRISLQLKGIAGALGSIIATGPAAGGSIKIVGTASKFTATSMLKLGAAVLMIGLGISSVILSLTAFITVIDSAKDPTAAFGYAIGALAVSLGAIAIGMIGVGIAATLVGQPLLIAGAAFALIGLGIGLVVGSLALLVLSFSKLIESFVVFKDIGPAAVYAMLGMAGGVGALALAMTALGNPLALLGMASFISYLVALKLVGSDLADVVKNLAVVAKADIAKVFTDIASGIEGVNKKIKGEIQLQSTIENLALITTGQSSKAIGTKTAGGVDKLSSAIEGLKQAFKTNVTINLNKEDLEDLIEKGVYKTVAQ